MVTQREREVYVLSPEQCGMRLLKKTTEPIFISMSTRSPSGRSASLTKRYQLLWSPCSCPECDALPFLFLSR
jgi:hypothetical protein